MKRYGWLLGLLAASGMAHAQYTLTTGGWLQQIEEGAWVEFDTVGIGDVNGDGRDDLVSVTADHRVRIYLQKRDGSLASPLIRSLVRLPCEPTQPACPGSNYNWPTEVTLADLDGDGGDEIIVPHYKGLSTLSVLPVGGGRTVLHEYEIDELTLARDLSVLDVDGDGKRDVVGFSFNGNNSHSYMEVYYGDGSGGVERYTSTDVGTGVAYATVAADLDRDGWQDLAVSTRLYNVPEPSGWVDVYYGAAGVGLLPAQLVGVDDALWGSLSVADVDSNGWLDLVHATVVYHQSSARTFTAVEGETPFEAENALGADLDGDGDDDFLMIGASNAVAYQLQQEGALGEAAFVPLAMGHANFGHRALAVGDLDSDHCTDVAVAAQEGGLTWLLGSGCAPRIDLHASLGLTATTIAVRVDNFGAADAQGTSVEVAVSVLPGSMQVTDVPRQCQAVPGDMRRYRCELGIVAAAQSRTLVFGITAWALTSRSMLTAEVRASSTSPETNTANNGTTRRLRMGGWSLSKASRIK